MYNPKGLYKNFRPAMGIMYEGVIHENFYIMHFYAQNAAPGLYEGRNGRVQKKSHWDLNFCIINFRGITVLQNMIHCARGTKFAEKELNSPQKELSSPLKELNPPKKELRGNGNKFVSRELNSQVQNGTKFVKKGTTRQRN